MSLFPPPNIIVAMDFESSETCLTFAQQLNPSQCRLKVGKALFTASGPKLVEKLIKQGFSVFLDLKYHDIPNTVANAVRMAAKLGVWMVNVHASGGMRMLTAAKEALDKHPNGGPLLIGVTVLTSMNWEDLQCVGIKRTPDEQVMQLATLTQQAGLDGVVCSAIEAKSLREQFGRDFCLVTPGIRPANSMADDQHRVASPSEAIKFGSDYLVIGRPITSAKHPAKILKSIIDSISTPTTAS